MEEKLFFSKENWYFPLFFLPFKRLDFSLWSSKLLFTPDRFPVSCLTHQRVVDERRGPSSCLLSEDLRVLSVIRSEKRRARLWEEVCVHLLVSVLGALREQEPFLVAAANRV